MTSQRVLGRPGQLLERNRELAEIDACISAASAEEGSFLVLEGHAGMGKSALLAEVRRRAAAAGLVTCSALGSELEREFTFGVVRQLFEPAVGTLSKGERARVFEGAAALAEPALGGGGESAVPDPFAALHGLYWLTANLAARTPLLLLVDDAHWADATSLRWLAYVLNRLEGLPLLVAIATRPPPSDPQGEVVAAILAQPQARILPVGPLGEGSVAALVRTRLGAAPDPVFTAACLRATAGNPLGLNELLRELRANEVEPTSASAGELEKRAPDAIARRVRRDLSSLGEEAERLASAVAVIGDGAELRLTARLADLDPDRAAEAADDLFAADILASERPPRFAHPLLRAAIYDHLPEGPRQKLHRRAAEILRSEEADPEAVAAHLLRCDAGTSAETIACLRAAAPVALRRGAPRAAVSYLRRALVEDAPAAQRTAVLAELGRAEVSGGDPAGIGHLRQALTGTTDRRSRGRILSDLAAAVQFQSNERESRDLNEQALEEFRGCDEEAATRLECIVIAGSVGDPRVESSGDPRVVSLDIHYPRLRELARTGGSSAELARAALAYMLSWRDGNREEALTWLGAGLSWNLDFKGHGMEIGWLTSALLGIDELHRAANWCETVSREAAREGSSMSVLAGLWGKTWTEFHLGQLAEAEADASAGLEMSQQYFPFWVLGWRKHLAEIFFERGRQQAAYKAMEEVNFAGALGAGIEAETRESRGRLRSERGWREGAVEDLRASGRLCELHGLRNPLVHTWPALLAAALAEDSPEEAWQLAQAYLDNARHSGIPRAIGIALHTLAGLNHDNSIDLLRAAIATLEEAPAPLELARALTDLGAALRRQGYRVEAREPLREALEIAARCGAVPLVERAQAEAMAAGARPRRPRLRGVDALTPSELRVARLAAEGRSNREIAQALFITVKTVTDHLGSSYGKLGITSREKLAAALEQS